MVFRNHSRHGSICRKTSGSGSRSDTDTPIYNIKGIHSSFILDIRVFRIETPSTHSRGTDKRHQTGACPCWSHAYLRRKAEHLPMDRSPARNIFYIYDEPCWQKGKHRLQEQQMDLVRRYCNDHGSRKRTLRQVYNEIFQPDVRSKLVQSLPDDHNVCDMRTAVVSETSSNHTIPLELGYSTHIYIYMYRRFCILQLT